MKKTLFLLVALLGVVGMAKAAVDFNLATPTDLATNTLSIDKSATATTQEFSVTYGTEDVTFVGTASDVKIVDATYTPIAGITTVNSLGGNKFSVTLNATSLPTDQPILIAFPEGAFKAATSGEVNKKFGVHLDVCNVAKFTVKGDQPSKGTWTQSTLTWLIPSEFVTPETLTGTITSNPAGYERITTVALPAGLTWNANGTFSIAKDYAATYTIPAGAFKVQNANKSWSYSPDFVLTVNQYTQAVNMTVKDATDNSSYNPNKEVSTATEDFRIQFFKGATVAGNELNNIDLKDLTEFTITGTANDGTVVDITIPGSEFAYTSTNENKTFTHALGQYLHAGSYTACMHFNTENMVIAGVEKIRYEYVYRTFDVYQVATKANAAIVNANALEGEDIYITIDGLDMNMKNHASSTLALLKNYDTTKNKTFSGNFPTYATPYVTNAAGVKTDIVSITYNETAGTYTVKLAAKLDAGKGYILTFPANTVYVQEEQNLYYNTNLVAVNLDILHGFEFFDVADNTKTTSQSELVSDTYDRLHFTRSSTDGKLAAQVLPFNVETADVPEMEFYQITAAVAEDAATKLYIKKVNGTAYAWQPYMVKVNSDIDNLYLENDYKVVATVPAGAGSVKSATVFDEFTFNSTASGDLKGLLPTVATTDYLLMGAEGNLNTLTEAQRKAYNQEYIGANASKNKTIHQWRFYVVCDHTYGVNDGVDYSKVVFVEDEATGINSVAADAENAVMFNVAGQRISAPVKGQVYIMNGKKYIAK